MPKLRVRCPNCSASYKIDESLEGKRGRCWKCKATFVITNDENVTDSSIPETPQDSSLSEEPSQTEDHVPATWQEGSVILDLYEVQQVFESGGMGLVYKVHHKGWNQQLAVKCPRADFFKTEKDKQNFEREAETWVNLDLHPHIVGCWYVRRLGGIPRIFAEFVEGGTLQEWIYGSDGQAGKLYAGGAKKALARIIDIAIQFAWGLHSAHEQGLIHQDVKPGNVMMTENGIAKVTDFGLAKARSFAGEVPGVVRPGQSILVSSGGMTPAYCSPEQANREQLSRKTDIWSWAVSILEMFTGDVTWPSGTVAGESLEAYLEMGARDEQLPKMPQELADLLRSCFQSDPEVRPRDMVEIAKSLRTVYRHELGREYPRKQPNPAEALADTLNNRAVSLFDLGKPDNAEDCWEQALRAQAQHPEATYNLGLMRWRTGRLPDDDLLKILREMVASDTDAWLPYYLLGCVELERGDCAAVIQTLDKIGGSDSELESVRDLRDLAERRSSEARSGFKFEEVPGKVEQVSLSGDGRIALTGGNDYSAVPGDPIFSLKLWDVPSGRPIRTFDGFEYDVNSLCLSYDGKLALVGSTKGVGEPGQISLWDAQSGHVIRRFKSEHKGTPYSLAFSHDASHACSAWGTNEVRLWDVGTGHCIRTLFPAPENGFNDNEGIGAVRFLGTGLNVLMSRSNRIEEWDLDKGELVRTFPDLAAKSAYHVTFFFTVSEDERVAISGGEERTLSVWDIASGRCLRTFSGHKDRVTTLSLNRDGTLAMTGSWDSTVRLWDTSTGRCLRTFTGHPQYLCSVAISPDGKFGISGGWDKALFRWNLSWDERAPSMVCRARVVDSMHEAQEAFRRGLRQAEESLQADDVVKAAQHIRTARSQEGYARQPEGLEAWTRLYRRLRRTSLKGAWELKTLGGHNEAVEGLSLNSDGRQLLSKARNNQLHLWSLPDGKHVRSFEIKAGCADGICLSRDGSHALVGFSKKAELWDTSTGRCLRTFEGHNWGIGKVSFSYDERHVLTADSEQIKIWERSTGRCVKTMPSFHGSITCATLSADSRFALGVCYNTPGLWDVATGKVIHKFEVPMAGWARAACLSSDGRRILSGSDERTLRWWNAETGECLLTLTGHTNDVDSVSLSSDDRFAISGSEDATVRIWDMTTGQCVRTLEGHTHGVNAVCMSRDGSLAVSGGLDNTIKIWRLDWELEDKDPADWDEGVRHHLESFLTCRTTARKWWEKALSLAAKPSWTDSEFKVLLETLGNAGYGWLRPEGVRRELESMASNWKVASPLG